ncbi:MAG: hypothetical protein EXR67_06825 [Dehalococcoidia bacterium]|nr:hypothetical protein [Dehalococcoidia bacterium]
MSGNGRPATMDEAESQAHALDARMVVLGDPEFAERTLEAFRDSLYDYRADGDLEAHVARVQELLDEALSRPEVSGAYRLHAPEEGPIARAWRTMFSSG